MKIVEKHGSKFNLKNGDRKSVRSVNSGVFASKNRYRASIGDAPKESNKENEIWCSLTSVNFLYVLLLIISIKWVLRFLDLLSSIFLENKQ